jgi:hypothetical protein|tara:strand:+ start:34 stop:159 length:126 start_codon:yes stop_codon:yes gene_type:complete
MKFTKFIECYKWFKTKFPTLKELERKQLEEKLKELKKQKEK